MSGPTPRPGIMDIAPYVAGESAIEGQTRIIKLSSNEGAYGPSPKAIDAYNAIAADLHRYPDGGATALRQTLAAYNGIDAERIVCGAGSDEIISLLCNAYAGPGDEVLYTEHGFLMYAISARACGATPVSAPERDLHTDVDALLERVNERTRIVFVANPNNPTGTYIADSEVERLWRGLPDNVVLVLDAAYAEFVDAPDYSPGQKLVERAENVIMTRTFSKLYALGGLRLGWGYGSRAIADVLNRVRGPFNVGSAALATGLAALQDTGFATMVAERTAQVRDWTTGALHQRGIATTHSVCNFILLHLPDAAGQETGVRAASCDDAFKREGIIVRRVSGYGLPDRLRVTVGTQDEMESFMDALDRFLAKTDTTS